MIKVLIASLLISFAAYTVLYFDDFKRWVKLNQKRGEYRQTKEDIKAAEETQELNKKIDEIKENHS